MTGELWRKLDLEFSAYPMMKAEPVDLIEIEAAAGRLNCTFDHDYLRFVQRYGGAMVGSHPILGLRRAEVMGRDAFSVVEVTERFRRDGWHATESWYVVSIDGAGNPIGIDGRGQVWLSDHNSGQVELKARSFSEFVGNLMT